MSTYHANHLSVCMWSHNRHQAVVKTSKATKTEPIPNPTDLNTAPVNLFVTLNSESRSFWSRFTITLLISTKIYTLNPSLSCHQIRAISMCFRVLRENRAILGIPSEPKEFAETDLPALLRAYCPCSLSSQHHAFTDQMIFLNKNSPKPLRSGGFWFSPQMSGRGYGLGVSVTIFLWACV